MDGILPCAGIPIAVCRGDGEGIVTLAFLERAADIAAFGAERQPRRQQTIGHREGIGLGPAHGCQSGCRIVGAEQRIGKFLRRKFNGHRRVHIYGNRSVRCTDRIGSVERNGIGRILHGKADIPSRDGQRGPRKGREPYLDDSN